MTLFHTTNTEEISKAQYIINTMRDLNKVNIDTRKWIFTQNFNLFWSSPDIAKAICEELWTWASEWFIKSYQEQLAIKDLDPTWEMLIPPYECTLNEDWTVTIK